MTLRSLLFGLLDGCLLLAGCVTMQAPDSDNNAWLPLPEPAQHRTYLGLHPEAVTFVLEDVEGEVLFVELFDMYCHRCQKVAPAANELYRLLQERGYGGRIKMLGIAMGNTEFEAETFRQRFRPAFPVVPDRGKAVSRALGCELTPSFIALRKTPEGELREFYRHQSYFTDAGVILERLLRRAGFEEPGG